MRQLKNPIHAILAGVLCFSILSGFRFSATPKPASLFATGTITDIKSAALEILKNRCNRCHVRQNPGKVFTSANMDSFAANIHEQVFIKRRMPRGNRVRLTEDEYNTLRNWLIYQNIK